MITRDDWLKAVEEAEAPHTQDSECLTLRDLCEVFGVAEPNARRRIRLLVEQGRAVQTTKLIRSVTGAWRPVPAYRLITPSRD